MLPIDVIWPFKRFNATSGLIAHSGAAKPSTGRLGAANGELRGLWGSHVAGWLGEVVSKMWNLLVLVLDTKCIPRANGGESSAQMRDFRREVYSPCKRG